ncbi:CLUMA_CG002413, isoform A [Clunio marinus]|uniref:CLUMA_CG002413, isoform A n=1 Tax=Clunio marinus TaxID=568069 RepID=A0A1J1HM55_9DIPT|nr:CLUMA_CG002413, isoform A [Clunio marinus]
MKMKAKCRVILSIFEKGIGEKRNNINSICFNLSLCCLIVLSPEKGIKKDSIARMRQFLIFIHFPSLKTDELINGNCEMIFLRQEMEHENKICDEEKASANSKYQNSKQIIKYEIL